MYFLFVCFFKLLAHGCQQLVEKQQQQDEEEKAKKQLSTDLYYNYQDVSSGPSVTVGSEIPENLLHLSYPWLGNVV